MLRCLSPIQVAVGGDEEFYRTEAHRCQAHIVALAADGTLYAAGQPRWLSSIFLVYS